MSFQDGPPTEIDAAPKRNSSTHGKPSKWQPLSTVEPSPVAENDPFSLGDSDDEKDIKKEQTTVPESDQSKKANTEAVSEEVGSNSQTSNDKGAVKPHESK